MNRPPVVKVLVDILAGLSEVTFVTFFVPPVVPKLQDRLSTLSNSEGILTAAMKLRAETHLPFWDSINLSLFDEPSVSEDLLREAQFHNERSEVTYQVLVRDLTEKRIQDLCVASEPGILVLSSLLSTSNGIDLHLPMLDFHCPVSAANEKLAFAVAKNLGISGYLIQSGKSYHFYGERPFTDKERLTHLARALLFAPIIDRAWIAHQLLGGASGLRISNREERHVPFVVAKV